MRRFELEEAYLKVIDENGGKVHGNLPLRSLIDNFACTLDEALIAFYYLYAEGQVRVTKPTETSYMVSRGSMTEAEKSTLEKYLSRFNKENSNS